MKNRELVDFPAETLLIILSPLCELDALMVGDSLKDAIAAGFGTSQNVLLLRIPRRSHRTGSVYLSTTTTFLSV